MIGKDGMHPQIQLAGKNKVYFDIDAERDTFFEERYVIGRNPDKLHFYEMTTAFDSNSVVGPSQQHGTLHIFL